ncbi:MAG: hypothetical protein B6D63_07050 [Candidatus Latescibacteria bacterium 4484_7]|nr:MAG: hypothetical protein B6D63_07050 [Candidatus Latescibacteria bacterium 4484_7]
MEEPDNGIRDELESGEERLGSEGAGGGFVASLGDIFVDPMKVFERINNGLAWWKAYIVLAAVGMLLSWLAMPFQRHLVELQIQGANSEKVAGALENFDKFKYIGVFASPVSVLLLLVVMAALVHLVISVLSTNADFKKTLSLISYAGLISVLGQAIKTVVLLSRGVESVSTRADMNVHLSLAAFLPELKGFKYALVESLGIFEIWYYVVLAIGISYVFRIKKETSWIPVLIIWLISLLFLALGAKFAQ